MEDDDLLHDDGEELATTLPEPLYLGAPGAIDHAETGERSYWLGFRVTRSAWPGYLRIGFASDLDFNSATLEVHHSEFERLKEGIARFSQGRPAGVQFNTPAELATARYRRVIGAMMFEPSPPLGKIELVNVQYDPVLHINGLLPDVIKGLASVPQQFGLVEPGPARRALRRPEEAIEALMPQSWLEGEMGAEARAVIRERFDGKYAELRVALENARAQIRGESMHAVELDFDFGDWPAIVSVETTGRDGARRTEVALIDWPDVRAMREHQGGGMLRLRAAGTMEVEVPNGDMESLIDKIESYFSRAESMLSEQLRTLRTRALNRFVREKIEELQLCLPFERGVSAGRPEITTAPPTLSRGDQPDLFRAGSVPAPASHEPGI